jgi:hypothetical protein
MPHLMVADLAAAENPGMREMVCNACYYLLSRGETRTGHDLARELRQHWRDRLGDDDLDTLAVTYYLAWALRDMGRYAEARDLSQDTLDRSRRLLGEDHLSTLNSASNLAIDLRELGEVAAARDLDQDTLDRRRRVLGEDHPSTLASASNLAIDLRELGEVGDASDRDAPAEWHSASPKMIVLTIYLKAPPAPAGAGDSTRRTAIGTPRR